jgi:hypothetical protein
MSPERLAHVLERPEMAPLAGAIAHTLARPERVIQSRSDPHARLYYRYHRGTLVGDKYACVVVKVGLDDAFVVTAYLTDQIKRGIRLWPPST